MGAARKLRTIKTYPELRKIRGYGHKTKFNYPILIFAALLIFSLAITFKNEPEQEKKEKIKEFVEKSLQEKNNKQKKYYLCDVSDKQAKEIFELTGIDIKEYTWTIENFFLYHTINKHGSDTQEQKRGQLGVEITDFELIQEIINNPDKIELLKSKHTNTLLQLEKRIDKLYFYVVEIRKGKKEIVGKTMFKRN